MKQAFVLKDHNDPLLPRPQLWFNMLKFQVLKLLSDHPLLEFCHITEENLPVFLHIIPLMPIHVDPLFQSCSPPSQLVQPVPSCALQQPNLKHIPKYWEDLFIKSVSELHGGDVPCVQAH